MVDVEVVSGCETMRGPRRWLCASTALKSPSTSEVCKRGLSGWRGVRSVDDVAVTADLDGEPLDDAQAVDYVAPGGDDVGDVLLSAERGTADSMGHYQAGNSVAEGSGTGSVPAFTAAANTSLAVVGRSALQGPYSPGSGSARYASRAATQYGWTRTMTPFALRRS